MKLNWQTKANEETAVVVQDGVQNYYLSFADAGDMGLRQIAQSFADTYDGETRVVAKIIVPESRETHVFAFTPKGFPDFSWDTKEQYTAD